ncbi:hypothetical protein F0P96_19025 [Hymenobacter busanensis]|uniref:Uncharacterized protein n=1 Tax=Hymenobacter busanensis TaxID=2607656 RepID=A0A7L4ZXY7_9BACT|nr:hypothetical protein [Hymenobacter busanensis]KAA9325860.1 hypothetical protein F0P96_19025 [Hymenobacter busanensis]QHJ06300.1 hypothetical protein GUY19_02900 [Hymenobacter busanensis]
MPAHAFPLPAILTAPPTTSTLPRQHRAWIALYALEAGAKPRSRVLSENDVTEADLLEFEESWLALRCRMLTPVG